MVNSIISKLNFIFLVGSGPPKSTGFHRYVFLVYRQNGKIHDSKHGHLTNRSGNIFV